MLNRLAGTPERANPMTTSSLHPDRVAKRMFVWTMLYAVIFVAVAMYVLAH
jgi:hypothetical protein